LLVQLARVWGLAYYSWLAPQFPPPAPARARAWSHRPMVTERRSQGLSRWFQGRWHV